ncbi:cell envelope biogenesis protein TolA [Bradyrhizobium liaoningense]|uniref:cell envelope biogenesis protein TolA n=1 Tax=Bradyrhizobium liaoningense TaxID=43992 RepID=UPI001BAA5DE4|nr:cell envelope biogenesis protein TolA [Bradyrhizobium liaoningense]MBR0716413.1 cell envelope biogenesis protein TolA [Bradyrhizobium liaoningense]
MARKLKTFQTSLGFFDLAIAAPSMKAALEAWGANSNLFHQGAAKESDDPDVIAAAMKKPGVVLRRPVGSNRSFSEQAELPSDLGGDRRSTNAPRKSKGQIAKKPSSRPVDKTAERKAALANEREERRRESERAREGAAREKERERRRQQAIDKAQAALDKAEQEHAKRAVAIQAEVEALAKRSQTEDDRWNKERKRLEAALQRARS